MKVIGAGLPRTGTMSMQAALDELGFPCYHMETVVKKPAHTKMWDAFISGESEIDWALLYDGFEAAVDAPSCFYAAELLMFYPEAKVVLTVREPARWFASISKLNRVVRRLKTVGYVVRPLGRFVSFAYKLHRLHQIPIESDDEALYLEAFAKHNAAVQEAVPAEKLLVFRVSEGWEPLCAFLGVPVPDKPFPHLNSGDETIRNKFREVFGLGNRV